MKTRLLRVLFLLFDPSPRMYCFLFKLRNPEPNKFERSLLRLPKSKILYLLLNVDNAALIDRSLALFLLSIEMKG